MRCHCALISKFYQVASAAIERMQKDEALKRSTDLLERTEQLSSTCCFSWHVERDEIGWSKALCQLFELDPAEGPVTLELIADRLHSEDFPSFQEMIERARSGVSDLEFEHRIRGALYIADDWHGRIWRVTHRGSYARNLTSSELTCSASVVFRPMKNGPRRLGFSIFFARSPSYGRLRLSEAVDQETRNASARRSRAVPARSLKHAQPTKSVVVAAVG
jgi:hypothetical protein